MKNENLFERGNHNQEPPTDTSEGFMNRNQDAIDILDRARQQVSYFDYATFLMLLHAANYLEVQGRI